MKTYFQWVYCACGPVENFTFLWVHSKEMSNQARKAWTSGKAKVQSFIRYQINTTRWLMMLTVVTGTFEAEGRLECEVFFFGGQEVDVLQKGC